MHKDFKIVCFGDSTTDAGFWSSDPNYFKEYKNLKVYSQWLEEAFTKEASRTFKVINSGISGDTTNEAKARFQKDVLSHNPNLVIIQFGVNDQTIRQDLRLKTAMVSLEQFAYNILFFISRIRRTGASIVLMTPGMLLWNETFKSKFFEKPYLINETYGLNGHLRLYNQMLRKIAKTENIHLIDIFKYQMEYDAKKKQSLQKLLPDGLHPNNKGHKFIADIIVKELHSQISYD